MPLPDPPDPDRVAGARPHNGLEPILAEEIEDPSPRAGSPSAAGPPPFRRPGGTAPIASPAEIAPAELVTEEAPSPVTAEEVVNEEELPAAVDAIRSIRQTHRLGKAGMRQRMVYALLARTLFEYRTERLMLAIAYLFIPVTILGGALLGFAVTGVMGWLLAWVSLGDLLVWAMAGLAFLTGYGLRESARGASVSLARSDGLLSGFQLGRFQQVFEVAGPATLGLFFGALFGIQYAVLMFTPGHVGLPIDGAAGECFLLTLDNACHGIFLDTFELYDVRWGKPLSHSFYSATVFYAFRLSFDALAFLIGYALWKRYRLWWFFSDFPRDERDVPGVLDWITARCTDSENWPRRYHDEMMFLLLAKAYITGDNDFVRHLSGELCHLQVKPEVRDLFRDAGGKVVFQGESE